MRDDSRFLWTTLAALNLGDKLGVGGEEIAGCRARYAFHLWKQNDFLAMARQMEEAHVLLESPRPRDGESPAETLLTLGRILFMSGKLNEANKLLEKCSSVSLQSGSISLMQKSGALLVWILVFKEGITKAGSILRTWRIKAEEDGHSEVSKIF